MSAPAVLIPNVGADEHLPAGFETAAQGGRGTRRPRDAVVGVTAELWRSLFGAGALFAAADAADAAAPAGGSNDDPAFPWLAAPGAAFAWLNTEAAARAADRAGRTLWGAPPDVVRVVHDKAFSHRVACSERLLPTELADAIEVLAPETLRDEERAIRLVEERTAAWPAWMAGRFTLKPRFGTSGRGRVAGRAGQAAAARGAFARLADSGGAMLEPWLARCCDLSAQLWLGPEGELVLLGTTELCVTEAGVYRGQRGTIDSKGRVTSGTPFDEPLRSAAVEVAQAARAAGYWGPCGLDAFAFRVDDRVVLRPVVELNARFTLGVVALGALRRLLPRLRSELRPAPSERRAFYFGLGGPPAGWPDAAGEADELCVPLLGRAGEDAPGVLIGRDREAIDRRLGLVAALGSDGSDADRSPGRETERG